MITLSVQDAYFNIVRIIPLFKDYPIKCYIINFFTHLKLCFATANRNFKSVKIFNLYSFNQNIPVHVNLVNLLVISPSNILFLKVKQKGVILSLSP